MFALRLKFHNTLSQISQTTERMQNYSMAFKSFNGKWKSKLMNKTDHIRQTFCTNLKSVYRVFFTMLGTRKLKAHLAGGNCCGKALLGLFPWGICGGGFLVSCVTSRRQAKSVSHDTTQAQIPRFNGKHIFDHGDISKQFVIYEFSSNEKTTLMRS